MTAIRPLPGTSVQAIAVPARAASRPQLGSPLTALSVAVATISNRMRLNIFAHRDAPEPSQAPALPQNGTPAPAVQPKPSRTYPADMVVWGFVVRSGYDELDDPWYHRGVTQHAYLEGNDLVALCGFRPPISGPRERRRPRLGLPSAADHPMCGMCARMVTTPRPRVPVPVQPYRPAVPVPVARGGAPVSVAARLASPPQPAAAPAVAPGQPPAVTSPWVRRYAGAGDAQAPALQMPINHDSGLLSRTTHTENVDR